MVDNNGNVWITAKEAALRLNLSVSRIYHIKNRLTHRKIGDSPKSRILFLERAIVNDYLSL